MSEDISPYVDKYPIACRVTEDPSAPFQCRVYSSPGYEQIFLPDNDDERYHIVIEAYRGLRHCFGETLFFSLPQRAVSYVYRSEREFLEGYEERFAWRCHCYQSATERGEPQPRRYAGMVFLRPWDVHWREARDPIAARNHSKVAPAICEGYLRPPRSVELSPHYCKCFDNYARAYSMVPFTSIPFATSGFGAVCGHATLASCILMNRLAVAYSPYELAVAATKFTPIDNATSFPDGNGLKAYNTRGVDFFRYAKPIVEERCFAKLLLDVVPLSEKDGRITDADERKFAEHVCNFLYQGIPILYAVDYDILYSDTALNDEYVKALGYGQTRDDDIHIVLIYSVMRSSHSTKDGAPLFVFSDSTNLHTTGNIFHCASCRRLLAARARGGRSPCAQPDHTPRYLEAALAGCVPRYFTCGYVEAYERANARGGVYNPRYPFLTLRDRSQLRGYLLHFVFPDLCGDFLPERGEIQRFRELVRDLDVPPFVWIARDAGGNEGTVIDVREGGSFTGSFSTLRGRVELSGERSPGHMVKVVLSRDEAGGMVTAREEK